MPRSSAYERCKHKVGKKSLIFKRDLGHQNYGQGAKQSALARAKLLRSLGMRAFVKKVADGHKSSAYFVYKRRR